MNESFILNLPEDAVQYNPTAYDFVSFADKKFISDNSPILKNQEIFKTPDGKTYLKYNFSTKDGERTFGTATAYRVFDNALALIEFFNPPFEETEFSVKEEESTDYSHDNTTTEDILNWALNTYNYKNPTDKLSTIKEARQALLNGEINYYFDIEDGVIKEMSCDYLSINTWVKDLPLLTSSVSEDGAAISFSENTELQAFKGNINNLVTGDYMFYNTPLLESYCENTFPNLQSARYMFSKTGLKEQIHTSEIMPNISDATGMFSDCTLLERFSRTSPPKVSDYMFKGCHSLSSVKFDEFGLTENESHTGIFYDTPELKEIDFGNTLIYKMTDFPTADVESVDTITLSTEESDASLVNKIFETFTRLRTLNLTMSPFPFKNTDTDSLVMKKDGDTITYTTTRNNGTTTISTTSDFENNITGFFKVSPIQTITLNSTLDGLTMAKDTFSLSMLDVVSVQNLYDSLPTYTGEPLENHIITVGINCSPSDFYVSQTYSKVCGEFVQWDTETQSPAYETNVTSNIIESTSGDRLFEENGCRDEEFPDVPKSNTPYVSWVDSETTEDKTYYFITQNPIITKDEEEDNVKLSFSNFRCLYNTYSTETILSETMVIKTIHNNFGGEDAPLDSYIGPKENVYVQIIQPKEPSTPPSLPNDDGKYVIEYYPKEGDTVIYAGRLNDLEDDSILLDKSTLYQYYIEQKNTSVELQITPPQDKTTKNRYDFIISDYMKGDDYEVSFTIPSITERVCTTVSLGNIRISSNEGKSLGFVTSKNTFYSWDIIPTKTPEGNLLFTLTDLQDFGISWQIIEEEVEVPNEEGDEPITEVVERIVHEEVDVSNTTVSIVYTKENGTTITFKVPTITQDIIVHFPQMYFQPYSFFISELFTENYTITEPSIEQKNFVSSINDAQIVSFTEEETEEIKTIVSYIITRYISETEFICATIKVALPSTFPDNNFFYNSGFIYENFKTIDEPVVLLKNDAFRNKGWKLDLRFNPKQITETSEEDTPQQNQS